jgi:ABC-type oligopeptide transport system substrate-binding subunit
MNPRPCRRSLLAAGPLALASCASGSNYFGKTETARSQHLIFQLGAEPETLDPALSEGGSEEFILPSIFEGLLTLHPTTNQPLAALATHYDSDSSRTQFTFYLRGHSRSAGVRLKGGPPRSVPDGFWRRKATRIRSCSMRAERCTSNWRLTAT